MDCEAAAPLLQASLDGELDAAHAADIDRHLAACPACAAELGRLEGLRAAIRHAATYHRLPAAERGAILRRLRQQTPARPAARGLMMTRRAVGGMAASLLLGAALGGWLGPRLAGSGGEGEPTDELVTAHVRALQPGHAIDVPSSDQHTVKPWFDGRVDFSPPVKDLGEQGFALIGGRLDYVDHHTAAVIVYRRRQHQIDLFVWPAAPDTATRPSQGTTDGYHVRAWTENGFRLAAVSDLNESELDEFVRRWRAA